VAILVGAGAGCGTPVNVKATALTIAKVAGTFGYYSIQAHRPFEYPGVTEQQLAAAEVSYGIFKVAIIEAEAALAANDIPAFQAALIVAGKEVFTLGKISAATCPVINTDPNKDKEK
jgi:hypothetical protein